MADYRSRIHENCSSEFITDLYTLVNKRSISDNNKKSTMVLELLVKHKIEYSNLGSGTNRVAVLIDGYVFKFALDNLGVKDNDSEFALSLDLQPFVIKTYESNGLISVCEYVELITNMGEFQANRGKIINRISRIVAMGFLVGDVGFNSKNFCNWGKRTATGELVILDFAYIYKLDPYKMKCQKCDNGIIEYDANFIDLVCQNCGRVTTFTQMRKMVITEEEEQDYIDDAKNSAVMLEAAKKSVKETEVKKEVIDEEPKIKVRETRTMRNNYYKTPLTEYSRADRTVFDEFENEEEDTSTIFDIIDDDKIPKSELYKDNVVDAYQESLNEMRASREREVRTDGSKPSGSLRAVMGDNGRVQYITIENSAPVIEKPRNNNVYNVTKKPQISQRPNINNRSQNNQRPNNQPQSKPVNQARTPVQQPKIETPPVVQHKIPETVVIPDLCTPDTKESILDALATSFNNNFDQEVKVLEEVVYMEREFNNLDKPVVEEVIEEVEPEVLVDNTTVEELEEVEDVNKLQEQIALADRFSNLSSLESDIEESEESTYYTVDPSESALVAEALANFNNTKAQVLAATKQTFQPKVFPGDPNTKIN